MLEVQVIMLVKLLGYIGVIIVGNNREIVCMKLSIAIEGTISTIDRLEWVDI